MFICNSQKYKFSKKYLYIPLRLDQDLPSSVTVEGSKLVLKDEFHVSLLCTKGLSSEVEEKILDVFCKLTETNDISFASFTGQYLFAERNSDNRKSLIAMCYLNGLKEIFTLIKQELDIHFDYESKHLTLYTLRKNEGIGINSKKDIEKMTKDVSAQVPGQIKEILFDLSK